MVEMPRILGDILKEALLSQADMEVVADVPYSMRLPSEITDTHTDVMIVGRELAQDDLALLRGCSEIAVLSLSNDGRSVSQYEVRADRTQLNPVDVEVSPQLIVDAIRAAARRRTPPGRWAQPKGRPSMG